MLMLPAPLSTVTLPDVPWKIAVLPLSQMPLGVPVLVVQLDVVAFHVLAPPSTWPLAVVCVPSQ
jgi:hypothetical protein